MKFGLIGSLLFFLIFSVVQVAEAARSEVRIAEKSSVRVGDPIRLGALLQGQVLDPELSAKIYDLVVFDPMTSEGEKIFPGEQLALILRQKLSFQDLQRVSVKIPEVVKVQARRNFIYFGDIKREMTEQAQAICKQCQIEFDDLKVPEIKTRDEVLQTTLNVTALKAAGAFLVPMHVQTSQGKATYWVTGRVSFFKEAPVAKRLIRANERIAESDFEIKRVNVSFAKDGIPVETDLPGKLAARTLSIGQPIFEADLKKEPAARRGQAVKILVGNETFEIATTGTAEEAGSVGDVIKVKSSDTQKMLSGVLIDRATVRIQ